MNISVKSRQNQKNELVANLSTLASLTAILNPHLQRFAIYVAKLKPLL